MASETGQVDGQPRLVEEGMRTVEIRRMRKEKLLGCRGGKWEKDSEYYICSWLRYICAVSGNSAKHCEINYF